MGLLLKIVKAVSSQPSITLLFKIVNSPVQMDSLITGPFAKPVTPPVPLVS